MISGMPDNNLIHYVCYTCNLLTAVYFCLSCRLVDLIKYVLPVKALRNSGGPISVCVGGPLISYHTPLERGWQGLRTQDKIIPQKATSRNHNTWYALYRVCYRNGTSSIRFIE